MLCHLSATSAGLRGPEKPGRAPVKYNASVNFAGRCPRLKIAVVNGVNFHFEVLSGVLHVLQPYERNVHIFLSPYVHTANFDGAFELVQWARSSFKRTTIALEKLQGPFDLIILVSPDYELQQNEQLIAYMNGTLAVSIVHNPGNEYMDKLQALTPRTELVTLSPHVAAALGQVVGTKIDWMLSVYPVPVADPCDMNSDEVGGIMLHLSMSVS